VNLQQPHGKAVTAKTATAAIEFRANLKRAPAAGRLSACEGSCSTGWSVVADRRHSLGRNFIRFSGGVLHFPIVIDRLNN